MEIIFYYYYVSMNNNNKPIGSSIKAIQYLRDKCKKKPNESPLHKRVKDKRSRLSIDRKVNLKVNTNVEYKGWDND